jgi:hypothetical protein
MTIVERRDYTATGGNSATLPILSPGLGVSGVLNRWVGRMLPASGSVAEWSPYTGTVKLTQTSATLQPTVATVSGYRVLHTDGVDDVIGSNSLTPAKAVTVLLRMLTAPGTTKGMFAWNGGYVQRGSTGTTSSVRTGATNLTQTTGADQPLFHTLTVINDFAGGVGATVIDGDYGVQATDRENDNLILGRGSVASFGSIEVLDVTMWGRALTQAECQTVRASYQAAYPGLVA